jgi:hypothetical protein
MKKIKIGFNDKAEAQYLNDLQAKQIAFQTLADYLLEYVENIDVNALYDAPLEYSIHIVVDKFKDAYKGAKVEKIFDIIGFNSAKVERLCKEFQAVDIEIDPNTLEATAVADFNIYAETSEQIEKYNAVQDVCNSIKVLMKYAPNIHKGDLIIALRGAVVPDYANNHIQQNIKFILNPPR